MPSRWSTASSRPGCGSSSCWGRPSSSGDYSALYWASSDEGDGSMSSALVVLIVIAVALAAVGVWVYLSQVYNSLVTLRHDVDQAWSNIDVLMRQRYDEVRELVDAIRAA